MSAAPEPDDVIHVDFLRGRPSPPPPRRVRVVNDVTLHIVSRAKADLHGALAHQDRILAMLERQRVEEDGGG